jgi:hypothetical protein
MKKYWYGKRIEASIGEHHVLKERVDALIVRVIILIHIDAVVVTNGLMVSTSSLMTVNEFVNIVILHMR